MIKFINQRKEAPFVLFKKQYEEALSLNQEAIEAISVASFCKVNNIVDTRFVNLKIVDGNNFIFFTNYGSKKAIQFNGHNQVTVALFWHKTNTQIRINGSIRKNTQQCNQTYFSKRSAKKNALAISSMQSKVIDSYDQVKKNYDLALNEGNSKKCPDYWGGYSITPSYFEFWHGHESRLNKRKVYELENDNWNKYYLQP